MIILVRLIVVVLIYYGIFIELIRYRGTKLPILVRDLIIILCLVIFLFFIQIWRIKCFRKWICSHLFSCFHDSYISIAHDCVRVGISIIKCVLLLFYMGILQEIHWINFRRQVRLQRWFFVCMNIKEICLVVDKGRIFGRMHERVSFCKVWIINSWTIL